MGTVEYDRLWTFELLTGTVHRLEQGMHSMTVLVVERVETAIPVALGRIMSLA
jgi:hypothetical protein